MEDGEDLTVVDAGLPASWGSLQKALAVLGRRAEQIRALVLTHAHFDHVGFAERLRRERGVEVWAHEAEVPLTRHPLRYPHERSRVPYLRNVRALPVLARIALAGAPLTKGIEFVRTYRDGEVLDVPGRPAVVFTPGHTPGHSSLWLGERDAVIAGDAIVTLDPYTGRRGPQIVAGAATADSALNLRSLAALADTAAGTVLTGHGPPWTDGVQAACERAWAAGAS